MCCRSRGSGLRVVCALGFSATWTCLSQKLSGLKVKGSEEKMRHPHWKWPCGRRVFRPSLGIRHLLWPQTCKGFRSQERTPSAQLKEGSIILLDKDYLMGSSVPCSKDAAGFLSLPRFLPPSTVPVLPAPLPHTAGWLVQLVASCVIKGNDTETAAGSVRVALLLLHS